MIFRRVVPFLAAAIGLYASTACAATAVRAVHAVPDSGAAVRRSHDELDAGRLGLGRAAMDQSTGNLRGVIEDLERLAETDQPKFEEADRAAFLLAEAYLRLGSRERFISLARRVEAWRPQSAYTRWLAWQRVVVEAGAGSGSGVSGAGPTSASGLDSTATLLSGPAATLAAGFLLRSGEAAGALRLLDAKDGAPPSSVRLYLHALALERTGGDALPDLEALARFDTLSSIGRDLAGAAWLQMAVRANGRGEDPRPLLARVATGSRFAPRARHLLAMNEIERGEKQRGAEDLRAVSADSTYSDRREAQLALASEAIERGDWVAAERMYEALDTHWSADRDRLKRRADAGAFTDLWSEWQAHPLGSAGLDLDAMTADLLSQRLATASADLTRRPELAMPGLDALATGAGSEPTVAPPLPADWDSVRASEGELADKRAGLKRASWSVARERERLADRQRYFSGGLDRVRAEAEHLLARATLLNALEMTIGSVDQQLRAVRDEECRRVALRTAALLDAYEKNSRWIAAMRWSALGGADSARARFAPAGYPGPASALAEESALGEAVRAVAESLAVRAPILIARSYAQAWRPSLIDRASAQDSAAGHALAWAHAVAVEVDSTRRASTSGETLRALEAEVAARNREAEQAGFTEIALHDRVARRTLARAIAALDSSREAIDYGLAAAAYALAVRLSPEDSARVRAPAAPRSDGVAPPDSAALAVADDALEDPAVAQWRAVAVGHLESFLARHPNSFARGEMRFRLADLQLIDARSTFRTEMALFMRAQAESRATGMLVPVQGHASALDLYRKILAEDRDFPHLDAVLFNAGMILADEGNAEAAQFFATLVRDYPKSPYDQEAWLRMGDMAFTDKRFPESVTKYAQAARGSEATLQAIAFYKMGWAHFNEDRFADAADAFGAVLDLYASEKRPVIQVDIEGEADAYLVHSLAGAGGASGFTSHFAGAGHRPYERHILMALAQHFRRYGEFPSAAGCDSLALDRFPLEADALLCAMRLIQTYERSHRPASEQQARLALAPRFAPLAAWANAQTLDSVRTAGADFAHASWSSAAFEYHRRAREKGTPEDWKHALELYQMLLAHWPHDPAAPALQLDAGEACVQVGDRAAALEHYRIAAESGPDSIAAPAMWQRVAVTDAWYESTRAAVARGQSTPGNDSLARAVIEAGDHLLERFPDHANAADIVWRESQLALAHGWTDRALADLGRLAQRFPNDARAPLAANQKAEILFRGGAFEAAGQAFEAALLVARRAGRDSLARRIVQSIPVCYYRQAEAAVAADSTRYADHAELFQKVATGWPAYEHADLAQYRAGLAWMGAGRAREAVDAMHSVILRFPSSDLVRDAHVQVAKFWESAGERDSAAAAYAAFARRYPGDQSSPGAWLKSADLLDAAGHEAAADELRLAYLRRYPGDAETAMEILEALARRELAAVDANHPISKLLGAAPRKGRTVRPPASRLADYLRRAAAHPKLASRPMLAQVRFLQGEEAFAAFRATRLAQPLTRFLPAKQRSLDSVLVRYRRSADLQVAEWAHASAFRIGEALQNFAEALERSERPADLEGDDLKAYEDVLMEQSRTFRERGEDVWTELLRQATAQEVGDAWTEKAQGTLWHRLGDRFFYRPEVEFPLVGGKPAARGAARDSGKLSSGDAAPVTPSVARRDGGPR